MTSRGITSRLIALLAFVLLTATACGSDSDSGSDEDSPADTESSTSSSTPEAEAEVVEATPEQFASIIAGQEKDWREVIDAATGCRFDWTIPGDGFAAEANRMTCYMREVTAGYTTQTAVDEIAELTPPASMVSLVEETTSALDAVANVDLEAACGGATKGPSESKRCTTTLGERMWTYTQLESALDQWGPYL